MDGIYSKELKKAEEFCNGRIGGATVVAITAYPGRHFFKDGKTFDANDTRRYDKTLSRGSVKAIDFVEKYAYDDIVRKDKVKKILGEEEDYVNFDHNEVYEVSRNMAHHAFSSIYDLEAEADLPDELRGDIDELKDENYFFGYLSKLLELEKKDLPSHEYQAIQIIKSKLRMVLFRNSAILRFPTISEMFWNQLEQRATKIASDQTILRFDVVDLLAAFDGVLETKPMITEYEESRNQLDNQTGFQR